MTLPKNYQPTEVEPQLEKFWQASGIYHMEFDRSELTLLQLGVANSGLAESLTEARSDLMSITRAKNVEIVETLNSETIPLPLERTDILSGIV
jgi:hypothetical protein